MTYEIHIGKSLQSAWETFLKAPEVFIALMLGQFALSFVVPRVPGIGMLLWIVVAALTIPSFVLVAEAVRREGRASFASLRPLLNLAPQVIAVFILKSIIITIGFMLLFVPGVIALVIYAFAEIIATVERKTFWDSLESSRRLVKGNWFAVFGLVTVCVLIVFAGVLFLGVGMLVSVPVGTLLMHAAYRDIRSQVGVMPEVVEAEVVS